MSTKSRRWHYLSKIMKHAATLTAAWVLCLVTLGVSVAAQASGGDKLERVTLHLKWMHAFQSAGFYAARAQGYYREEGLDVTIDPAAVRDESCDAVLSGAAEYGVWGCGLLNERLAGKPFVVIAVIFQHSPYIILSRRDSNIRVPSDLVGRRVMVDPNAGMQFLAMLTHEGLSADDVEVIPHTWRVADTIDGRVDASIGYVIDQPNQMRLLGVEPFVMRPTDYGIDFYGDCLFTTEAEIKRHPERVKTFRRASLKGWEYAMNHVDELIELILTLPGVKERGLTTERLRYEAEEMRKLILPKLVEIGHMNPGRWKHIADTYVSLGMLEPDYSLEGFMYEPNPPPDHHWLYALLGSLTWVVIVALLAWAWNRQLRRAVAERTRELAESEEMARVMLNATTEIAMLLNPDGTIVNANQSTTRRFGISREELVGKRIFDLLPAEVAESRRKVYAEVSAGKKPIRFEDENGGRHFDNSLFPILDGDGNLRLFAVFAQDVTKRKRAEKERERLSVAIEQAAEIIVITDTEATIEYVNPAFEKITGYTRWEAVGQNPRILRSGEHDDAFYKEMWEALTRGATWRGRFINKKKDGTLYTEEAVISPVRDVSGATVNYVAVKRDVTGKMKMEEKLRQAQKMEAVGRLAGGVAHDFNNLLMGIMNYVELCRATIEADHPMREWLDEITSDATRSANLTRQLLAFARKQTIAPKILDLDDVVTDMLKMLRRLIGEDIDLVWQPGASSWQTKMDPSQIDQILANLCVNARDAIGGVGKLTIETRNAVIDGDYCETHAEGAPGEYVMLVVSDDGKGMDHETQEHIFEPFFTTKEVGEGTGLGLATIYGIVTQNKGFVNVYSELGKGTTFRIYLPRHVGPAPEISKAAEDIVCPHGTETVLLVEDEKSIRVTVAAFLRALDYTVLVAESPEMAMPLAEKHGGAIQLLITDVVMPGMSGRDLANKLSTKHATLKVLYMSGYTADVIENHGMLDDDVNFLSKPFTRDALAMKVREVLDS